MFVNLPAVDYLRASSWSQEDGQMFRAWVGQADDVKETRFNQYRGERSSRGVWGAAMQFRDKQAVVKMPHFVLTVSGEGAGDAVPYVGGWCGGYATRVDLQITVPVVGAFSARGLKDKLAAAQWPRKRSLRLVEGEDGLDTVYIGSRQSERFLRVYVKQDESERLYLRCEVEFKGELARSVFERISADGEAVADLLAAEYEAVPVVEDDTWLAVGEALASWRGGERAGVARVRSDNEKRYRWWRDACIPALVQLLNHHDTRDRVMADLAMVIAGCEAFEVVDGQEEAVG